MHTAQHRCDGSYAIEQEIVLPTKVMRSIDMGKAVDQHEHKRNAESVVPVIPPFVADKIDVDKGRAATRARVANGTMSVKDAARAEADGIPTAADELIDSALNVAHLLEEQIEAVVRRVLAETEDEYD